MMAAIYGRNMQQQETELCSVGNKTGVWEAAACHEGCSAYGAEDRRVQGFGGETRGKETTWETQA